MTAPELRKHLDRDPFVPFEMVMCEGPAVPVRAKKKTLLSDKGGLICVVNDADLPVIHGIRHIVSVRPIEEPAASR